MAKVPHIGLAPISFIADADYSASQNRYRFFKLTASAADHGELATGASLGAPIGVLQNSPCSGEEASVKVGPDFSKLIVTTIEQGDMTGASPVQIGDYLTSTSTGQGRKAGGAASPGLARALEAITSGSAIIAVQLLAFGANVLSAS